MTNVIKTQKGQCIDVNKKDGGTVRVCPTEKDGEVKIGGDVKTGCQTIETPKRSLRVCNTDKTLNVKQA